LPAIQLSLSSSVCSMTNLSAQASSTDAPF
jgi:hypothetical protein